MQDKALLSVQQLAVSFSLQDGGTLRAVNNLSYTIEAGDSLAIVGESGSGKTVQARALLGILPPNGYISGGRAQFCGKDLLTCSQKELQKLRGKEISMVFQNPSDSLHPAYTVGAQLIEAGMAHKTYCRNEAKKRAEALLTQVGLPQPEAAMKRYPHEFSGGMCQRVMLAMSLMQAPRLLIADEPTTALDVTTQAQILSLLQDLQKKEGCALLFITHDLAVVAQLCRCIVVMYAGHVLESGTVAEVFRAPQSPYTRALLQSMPSLHGESGTKASLPGLPPDPRKMQKGCPFAPRCQDCLPICKEQMPPLREISSGHQVACWSGKESGENG